MPRMIARRTLVLGAVLAAPAVLSFRRASAAPPGAQEDELAQRLWRLEARTGGRLGVSVYDTETNISFGHRESERFALCSTYKALAVACVLSKVDAGEERLGRRIAYGPALVLPYSPVSRKFAGREGMTLGGLCGAAMTTSDATAGNLLLDVIGGPAELTGWLRKTGDTETRLDRREPFLKEARKDDTRDTTTPEAMLATLGRLALGDVLSDYSRQRLVGWMVDNRTGDKRLRAGLAHRRPDRHQWNGGGVRRRGDLAGAPRPCSRHRLHCGGDNTACDTGGRHGRCRADRGGHGRSITGRCRYSPFAAVP